MPIEGKNRTPKSITFNATSETVVMLGNVPASEVISTIAAMIPLTENQKILRVSATASLLTGSPAIQLVLGSIAPAGVGTTDEIATAGTQVFAAPVSITATNYNCQTIAPSNMNVIYPGGSTLTARVVTGAGDSATNLAISIMRELEDSQPTQPLAQPFGPTTF